MDRNLTAFLAVARAGNLTVAADRIGLTQPALTKTIRRLEGELGARLFDRSARGMAPDRRRATFMRHARAIETHWGRPARRPTPARAATSPSCASPPARPITCASSPRLIRALSIEFPETRFLLDVDVAAASVPRLSDRRAAPARSAPSCRGPGRARHREAARRGLAGRSAAATIRSPVLDRVPPEALRDRRWVIYRRDTLMRERLTEYFLRFRMPLPRIVVEVDALASTFLAVAGTPYLTAAPTTIRPDGRGSPASRSSRSTPPLWSFPSGAWMRRSTAEYPGASGARSEILARSLRPPFPGVIAESGGRSHFPVIARPV